MYDTALAYHNGRLTIYIDGQYIVICPVCGSFHPTNWIDPMHHRILVLGPSPASDTPIVPGGRALYIQHFFLPETPLSDMPGKDERTRPIPSCWSLDSSPDVTSVA